MTAPTCVCCSITSESHTRYGSRVPCHGSPWRPCRRCQRMSCPAKDMRYHSLRIMLAFILRRVAQAVLVMLTVGLIAFSLFRFVGDPVSFMLGQDATPEQRTEVTRVLGLDRPFYVQYL